MNKGVKKTRHRMSDCRCYLSDVRFRLHVTYAHLGLVTRVCRRTDIAFRLLPPPDCLKPHFRAGDSLFLP